MAKKIHCAYKHLRLRASVIAVAACLSLTGMVQDANAAGLGKIAVFSALGQPLRAEVEVTATKEELVGMKAQLASQDAFKQAGLDYASTLSHIRFALGQRANGQPVITLTSDRPVHDPFVDMLVELNWPAGRLVREYTFLLDPPEFAAKGAAPVSAPVVQAEIKTPSILPAIKTPAAPQSAEPEESLPPVKKEASLKVPEREKPDSEPSERIVKRGDTLSRIANETRPEGVSLEQMLVGLFRANPEAFDGGNMNRLKAGKIVAIPDKAVVEAITPGEAKKVVVAQSSDWNAYRSKLAAVVAQSRPKEAAAQQESAGRITARVEEKTPLSVESKDELKVSRTETKGGREAAKASGPSDDDRVAAERALKEANDRLLSLEKNVGDLQKLLELKNQSLAELQKQLEEKAAPTAVKPVEEAKAPVSEVKEPAPAAPVAVDKPQASPAPAPVVAPAVETKPADMPSQPPKAKPEPAAAPAMKPTPAAPAEPDLLDELLDSPLVIAGAGGLVALMAAYLFMRRRRAGKEEVPLDVSSTLSPPSSLSDNSVFRSTGGQSVDTSHTPVQTDFSQAGPGSIDTNEVDPVAEADVYMAYGRDAQAEEILLEAKQKDPKRLAIHLKLLEIYSNRKDLKLFDTLATEMYGETGGAGAEWEKVVAMGAKLDPGNPLYGGGAQTASAGFNPDATVIVSSTKNTVTLPGELSQMAGDAAMSGGGQSADLKSLDFDLGVNSVSAEPAQMPAAAPARAPEEAVALDFDLAVAPTTADPFASTVKPEVTAVGLDLKLPESSPEVPSGAQSKEVADLDFDLGFGSVDAPDSVDKASSQEISLASPATSAGDGVEFDVNLTESTFLGNAAPEPISFDMSSIDLDLKAPEIEVPVKVEKTPDAQSSFENAQVSTAVNPDFFAAQSETVVNPQFGGDFSSSGQQDFSVAQGETLVNPQFGSGEAGLQDFDISPNEEVTTKLDLAKAYVEMGDLEGARELLQEVISEGNVTQRENAQTILGRIGE